MCQSKKANKVCRCLLFVCEKCYTRACRTCLHAIDFDKKINLSVWSFIVNWKITLQSTKRFSENVIFILLYEKIKVKKHQLASAEKW